LGGAPHHTAASAARSSDPRPIAHARCALRPARDTLRRLRRGKWRLTAGANVPPARLHDLRHLHATTLLLAGVPDHVVAARLCHADPAVTLRVYAHVIREAATTVAERFAKPVSDAQR